MFNAKQVKDDLIKWIRGWFDKNGPGCNAIIGISGGKDSTVVAALCVEALGKDRVIGVMMPEWYQDDIITSYDVIHHLGIRGIEVNIGRAVENVINSIEDGVHESRDQFPQNYRFEISNQTLVNLPPRIRMVSLYAISQSLNGRVSNNCNLSEDYVGYSTRWGDSVGDFSPLANLTVTEVKAIGYELGLPKEFIEKIPSDGLCGKTDEDNLGFTYEALDNYIRTGRCDDLETRNKIDTLHKKNEFKMNPIPHFEYPRWDWDDILGWTQDDA